MICPYCGSQISDDAAFCPNCGGPQKEGKKETSYDYFSGSTGSSTQNSSGNNYTYTSGNTNSNISDNQYGSSSQPGYQKFNGMCIAGFVLSFFFSILGLIFSAIGYKQAGDRNEAGRGLAIAGLVLSIVFLSIKIITYFASGCVACNMYGWLI